MRDHGEISYLTRFNAFRMNRDQVMDLEHGSKSVKTSLILGQRLPKPYFYDFCDTLKNGQAE